MISIIPQHTDVNISDEILNEYLAQTSYHRLNTLDESDYFSDDGHFNKKGHLKYAEFLRKLILDTNISKN